MIALTIRRACRRGGLLFAAIALIFMMPLTLLAAPAQGFLCPSALTPERR